MENIKFINIYNACNCLNCLTETKKKSSEDIKQDIHNKYSNLTIVSDFKNISDKVDVICNNHGNKPFIFTKTIKEIVHCGKYRLKKLECHTN